MGFAGVGTLCAPTEWWSPNAKGEAYMAFTPKYSIPAAIPMHSMSICWASVCGISGSFPVAADNWACVEARSDSRLVHVFLT